MSVNTRAMGLGDGEGGTIQLKKEDIDKYFSSVIQHDPAYGEKTEIAFKDIIQKWPDDKKAYFCLMNYYQYAKRHDDLTDFIPEIVAAFKSEGYQLVDELLPYATKYMHKSQFKLASDFYQKLLVSFPKSAPVLSSYGVATLKLGDLETGLDLFMKAYDLDKKDPIIISNIGEAHIYRQEFNQAEKYLKLFLKVKPEKTETYFRLAALKMRQGANVSKKAWEKYLHQHQKYPD